MRRGLKKEIRKMADNMGLKKVRYEVCEPAKENVFTMLWQYAWYLQFVGDLDIYRFRCVMARSILEELERSSAICHREGDTFVVRERAENAMNEYVRKKLSKKVRGLLK